MAKKLFSASAQCAVPIIVLALLLTIPAPRLHAQQTGADASDTDISQAEQHFRLGVALYKDGNFREALDEFNAFWKPASFSSLSRAKPRKASIERKLASRSRTIRS